ncbi:MAG: hypothetical protein AMS23_07640 [Bacteroides sp. SM1_62]|nr:MAG: hypothetical protein AMS26_04165 [Bacteroides sp. SM23_62]KPL22626.1 MAG: hypothetical protein AMS23_07640 [Bacteroides sp. SM1_62]
MKKIFLHVLAVLFSVGMLAQEWHPSLTYIWEPVPPVVTPGSGTSPPSDAIILFDGSDLDQWVKPNGEPVGWKLEDGVMTVLKGTGAIHTKQAFGDIQLHLEWRAPSEIEGEGQGRGNSGVYLQGRYEIQILDCYENTTYVNGQTASVYKQHIPLANACRPPGEWQTYDIIFTAPRFKEDGSLFTPATVTVLHNGVLVQNHVKIQGNTEHIGLPAYKAHPLKQPLLLQDHSNPVSFRNIWVREL